MAGAATEEVLLAFDIAGSEGRAYRRFIEQLHKLYPPAMHFDWQDDFDIVLRSTDSHQIKLRLERRSFGLIGYQAENCWLEFRAKKKRRGPSTPSGRGPHRHRIAGSTFLRIYNKFGSLQSECMQKIESICLGKQQLNSAVNLLAMSSASHSSGPEWARSLIIVRLMICEAAREMYFCSYLAGMFHEILPAPLWIFCRILPRPYSLITEKSQCMPSTLKPDSDHRHHPEDGNHDVEPSCEEEEEGYFNEHYEDDDSLPGPGEYVEVFFVRISSIKGKDSGSFYGKIHIGVEHPHCQCIYSRRQKESEFVHSGDLILLTGPHPPFFPSDWFYLHFPLMGESSGLPSLRCAKGGMNFLTQEHRCDKLVIHEFYGEHCSVTFCYVPLKRAMYAMFTVTLVRKLKLGNARVYGRVLAISKEFDYGRPLFHKKAEEHIDVCPMMPVTLLRSAVVVPWDSLLMVIVELFEYSDDEPFDREIARDVIGFPLQHKSRDSERTVSQKIGEIEVKVRWWG